MANGWAGDGAVYDQIAASIADEVQRARDAMPTGASLEECEKCGEAILKKRQLAIPGVRLCLVCQQEYEESTQRVSLYNRRGSKDSQLR